MELIKRLRELENTREKSKTGWYITLYNIQFTEQKEFIHISLARYINESYQVDKILIDSDVEIEIEDLENKIIKKLKKFGIRIGGVNDSN